MEQPKYVITSSGDSKWHSINATSLRGAKTIASRTYEPSLNGHITVACEDGDNTPFVLSVKYGYDKKWTEIE